MFKLIYCCHPAAIALLLLSMSIQNCYSSDLSNDIQTYVNESLSDAHLKHSVSLEDLAFRDEKVLRVLSPSVNSVVLPALPTGYVVGGRPSSENVKIVNSIAGSNKPNIAEHAKEVSETDLYLLGAIEKLVHKMDAMDRRLRQAEELIQHLMEGSNIKRQDPCPANFTRISHNCYYIGDRQYNWKSASSFCKSMGAVMVELQSSEEYIEVLSFLREDKHLKGHDYWTGGLNPGLLWIWSNSARPVVSKESSKPEDTISPGNGRCLKLAYSGAGNMYSYVGSDCAIRLRMICEHEENVAQRALHRLHKALTL